MEHIWKIFADARFFPVRGRVVVETLGVSIKLGDTVREKDVERRSGGVLKIYEYVSRWFGPSPRAFS